MLVREPEHTYTSLTQCHTCNIIIYRYMHMYFTYIFTSKQAMINCSTWPYPLDPQSFKLLSICHTSSRASGHNTHRLRNAALVH